MKLNLLFLTINFTIYTETEAGMIINLKPIYSPPKPTRSNQ